MWLKCFCGKRAAIFFQPSLIFSERELFRMLCAPSVVCMRKQLSMFFGCVGQKQENDGVWHCSSRL
jgi:hypothetical protein